MNIVQSKHDYTEILKYLESTKLFSTAELSYKFGRDIARQFVRLHLEAGAIEKLTTGLYEHKIPEFLQARIDRDKEMLSRYQL